MKFSFTPIRVVIAAKYTNLTQRHQSMVMILAVFIGLLVIFFLFEGCMALASAKKKWPDTPMMIRQGTRITIPASSPLRTQIKVEAVRAINTPHIVSIPGVIEADPARTVNILPPLTGRVMSLNVNLGDAVHQGQVLAVISSPDLAQAYSDHDKAQSLLRLTTAALTRARAVYQAGGNSTKDVQLAQNDFLQAQSDAHRAAARLKTFGKNTFSLLTIKAPIAGKIIALNYGRGSYINDPTVALLSIANLDKIWVSASVPENLIQYVAKNDPVDVRILAYPQHLLHGKIAFMNPVLDPETRRNKTRIIFSNPLGQLQPNMFATIKLRVPQPAIAMIPTSAILMNDDSTSVFVETVPWCFKQCKVTLGTEDGDNVRILSGLKAGDRVAVSGGIFIND